MAGETGYFPINLKSQFPELAKESRLTLIPLLEVIAQKFFSKDWSDCGFTDIKRTSQTIRSEEYCLVAGGKIITCRAQGADIDLCDKDEQWLMTGNLHFESDHQDAAEKALQNFKNFVGGLNLEELKREAGRLLEEGKMHHLRPEMLDFYFPQTAEK